MFNTIVPSDTSSAAAAPAPATTTTTTATVPKLTLEQLFARPAPFEFQRGVTDPIRTAATASWIIYMLTERKTGRIYVGITQRTLPVRCGAHVSQARRGDPVHPDGLLAALRAMDARGECFADAFDARIVARALDAAEAAEQECKWITMLACKAPDGLNIMPGGGVGGVSNSRELTVETSPGVHRYHPSIYHAIGRRNCELRWAKQSLLDPRTVYARLSAHWSPAEALGYREHVDGRGQRAPFLVNDRTYTTLRQASRVTGILVETLRSSHYRQVKRQPSDGPVTIGADRRSGNGSADRELLAIIWPDTGEQLTAQAFSKRTGVPKATVIHRWHRARTAEAARMAWGEPPLTAMEMAEQLRTRTERRKPVILELPDGRHWTGGERELVRQVLGDRMLGMQLQERLSESGIRARLRLLRETGRLRPDSIRWAFGFGGKPGEIPDGLQNPDQAVAHPGDVS